MSSPESVKPFAPPRLGFAQVSLYGGRFREGEVCAHAALEHCLVCVTWEVVFDAVALQDVKRYQVPGESSLPAAWFGRLGAGSSCAAFVPRRRP